MFRLRFVRELRNIKERADAPEAPITGGGVAVALHAARGIELD